MYNVAVVVKISQVTVFDCWTNSAHRGIVDCFFCHFDHPQQYKTMLKLQVKNGWLILTCKCTAPVASNSKAPWVTCRGFRVRARDPRNIPVSVRGSTRKVRCRVRRLAGPRRWPAQSTRCFVGCYGGFIVNHWCVKLGCCVQCNSEALCTHTKCSS